MASGYLLSGDGAEISLYSGGTPESHGGGGIPVVNGTGTVGAINPHSGIRLHKIRRDVSRNLFFPSSPFPRSVLAFGLTPVWDGRASLVWRQVMTARMTAQSGRRC